MTISTRREVRHTVRLPVSIGGTKAALTADVSESGFRLESTTLLPQGLPVEGYVLLGEKELRWKGVVTWSRAGSPMMSTWHELGVKFTQVSPGLRALISIRTKG